MCKIFASIDPASYASETRSVRLSGHVTSIRLESAFWATLEQVAASQGVTLGRFLTKLYDEVLELHGDVTNFASLLRCACLVYAEALRPDPQASAELAAAASRDFAVVM
jgi:predicted DNA-binding ribbon-helix-helix protein